MHLRDLVAALEAIAPTRYAESWDNVGLLVGDPAQSVTRAMLTIDYTPAVAAEARELHCDAVVAYHPPIFEPIKRLTADGPASPVYDAARRGVAIYSPHTALDVAPGGTNDLLADAVGMGDDRRPLKPTTPKAADYKLVTFVPAAAVDAVSAALFAAGAGRVGKYTSCSFRTPGFGTFFGEPGSTPAVGVAGRLDTVDEVRLEVVVPVGGAAAVVDALRASHPYETPAFDLTVLAAPPSGLGLGRIGPITGTGRAAVERVKAALGLSAVLFAGEIDRPVARAAVCAGACGNLLDDAIVAEADFYLTGEMRHHDAVKAVRAGLTVICTLHSNSERAVLKRIQPRIEAACPGLAVFVSEADRDPFAVA